MDFRSLLMVVLAVLAVALLLCVLPYVLYLIYVVFRVPIHAVAGTFELGFKDVKQRLEWQRFEWHERSRQRHFARMIRERNLKNGGGAWGFQRHTSHDQEGILLREKAGKCCHFQRTAAHLHGVEHMSELQDHGLCTEYRTDMIRLLDFARIRIEGDPDQILNDATVGLKALLLECAVENCRHCDLLGYAREAAPVLCRTAQAFGAEVISD